jgi:hypothetical protein
VLTSANAEGAEKYQKLEAREGSRVRAWDQLLPTYPDKFAGPPSKTALVHINFVSAPQQDANAAASDEQDEPADGRLSATNVSGRLLHNVTLSVELFHYSTLPDPTTRQVYFLHNWPAKSTVELSKAFLVDPSKSPQHSYYVPATVPGGGMFGVPGVNPALTLFNGVVQVRATVWSDEARAPGEMFNITVHQDAVAKVLLDAGERSALGGKRIERPGAPLTAVIAKAQAQMAAHPGGMFSRGHMGGPGSGPNSPPAPGATTRPQRSSPEQIRIFNATRIVGSLLNFGWKRRQS